MGPAILGRRTPSQARLPVVDIRQNTLALRGGQRRQVLRCQPTQVALKDEQEQAAVLQAWTELLHALTHPIQVVLQVRPAEDRDLLGVKPNSVPAPMQGIAASYTALLADLCARARLVHRDFYVVVPCDPPVLASSSHQSRPSWHCLFSKGKSPNSRARFGSPPNAAAKSTSSAKRHWTMPRPCRLGWSGLRNASSTLRSTRPWNPPTQKRLTRKPRDWRPPLAA